MPARAKHDFGGSIAPSHDDIIWSHAIGEIIAIEGGGNGEALRRAARGWHDVDLGVAVVLGGESQLLAVGRKTREDRVARSVGEATSRAADRGYGVQLAGIRKGYFRAVSGGEAQETSCGLVGILSEQAAGAEGQQRKRAKVF